MENSAIQIELKNLAKTLLNIELSDGGKKYYQESQEEVDRLTEKLTARFEDDRTKNPNLTIEEFKDKAIELARFLTKTDVVKKEINQEGSTKKPGLDFYDRIDPRSHR